MILLAVVAILALIALTASNVVAIKAFSRLSDPPPALPQPSPIVQDVYDDEWIHREFEDLTMAVSKGIAGYERHEKRVQRTVTSARRLVKENGLEHAGIEAEADELHDGDDAPGEEVEVLALPAPVVQTGRTGIPGISHETLAEMREAANVGP